MSTNIQGGSFVVSSGALTATGAETVYDTTAAIVSCLRGKYNTTAAVTDGARPTSDGFGNSFTVLAASQGCVMLWCVQADDTVTVYQSDVVDLDTDTNGFKDGKLPTFPAYNANTDVPFAYQVLKNGSTGSAWDFGGTAAADYWNATGMTASTPVNIMTLPDRPQSS